MATAKKISSTLTRTFELDRAGVDEEKRTLTLSFSSESPVDRQFGVEVLDHSPGSCDLARLNNGAPLLFNHDTERQIGVVESASISDGRGTALVRFADDEEGEKYFRRVKTGISRKVSVGYRFTDRNKVDVTEDGGREIYRFRAWQPFEVSIVPIPADDSVGVGRDLETNAQDFELPMKRSILHTPDAPAGLPPAAPSIDAGKTERERATHLRQLGKQFRGRIENVDDLVDEAIEREVAISDFQRTLLGKLSTSPIPNGSEDAQRDGTSTGNSGGTSTVNVRSLGEELVRSEIFRAFASKKSGGFVVNAPGSFREHLMRATLLSTGLTSIQKVPGVILVDQQPNRISDLFMQGTTSATTIRFTSETSFTNAATAVAEEGEKPEATFALGETDVTVQKIAVIGRVSDEMIADYDYVQSFVNGQLLFMVAALEDNHLINGLGTSNQIRGVLAVSGIQTQAYATDIFTTVHKAKTKVNSTPGFVGNADTIVIHPSDYQNARLTKDSNGQYLLGGPSFGQYGVGGVVIEPPIWGLRPIITTAIAQGTAIVGNFKAGATLYRKGGVTLESTNSDASDFKYNRICIRAEERLALVPWKPKAFCKITGIPA
jgi:HK97 family phage major capsid protein/HK97 family phage prohead protease